MLPIAGPARLRARFGYNENENRSRNVYKNSRQCASRKNAEYAYVWGARGVGCLLAVDLAKWWTRAEKLSAIARAAHLAMQRNALRSQVFVSRARELMSIDEAELRFQETKRARLGLDGMRVSHLTVLHRGRSRTTLE